MKTQWKVYRANGDFVAQTHYAEDAVRLMDSEGDYISWNHKLTVWTEGQDGVAGESYDAAAALMHKRRAARWPAVYA